MEKPFKNIKVGEKHHEILKEYCDKNGLKIYKLIHKWIDENCKPSKQNDGTKKKDIYGD